MKRFNQILAGLSLALFVTVGCESMLEVDSDRFITPDENYINSPNDTIFSIAGVLTKLEKVAVRYVLLGELRGDLMALTGDAGKHLRDIYNFEATVDNPYVDEADYYSIINSCNYLINNIDTSQIVNAKKVYYKEFAAAKAIRAWTYMQIALNFKTAKYYEEPILTVKEAMVSYPEYTLEQLAPILIADLAPYKDIEKPGMYAYVGFVSGDNLNFFPIRFILGDLYLWTGQYEKAAIEYRDLMFNNTCLVHYYISTWTVTNNVFVSRDIDWVSNFYTPNREQMTVLSGSVLSSKGSVLDSLAMGTGEIIPSGAAIENWANQKYYYSATVVNEKEGDLRGKYGTYYPKGSYYVDGTSSSSSDYTLKQWEENTIRKYLGMAGSTYYSVCVYRKSLLYLRYAEAVNRLGKPNLAFAVLKNGLNNLNIANPLVVPDSEKSSPLPSYMNFTDTRFDNNIGIHARGCGNTHLATEYVVPAKADLQDSITAVEDLIIEELALETAFEGNRFHDLIRVAMRRNDPSYLANKVGTRNGDLNNPANWYLPKK
ncbi:MAG: RagB/SusD family nutrient uptake outer membrane protein [Breznakibacter sp.]